MRRFSRTCAGVWVAALACLVAPLRAEPVFEVRLAVRDGALRIDRGASRLQLGEHAAAFEHCHWTPDALQGELSDYLDGLLASRDPLLEFIAAPPESDPASPRRAAALAALRQLAQSDQDGSHSTGALMRLPAASWDEAANRYAAWFTRHAQRQPAVMTGMHHLGIAYKSLAQDLRLADGPLLPRSDPDDDDSVRSGVMKFAIAPPFRAAGRLRPQNNEAEWDHHRGELSQQLLAPFACKLWRRERIVQRVQDYLEPRGIAVQPYRTERDLADMKPLQVQQPEPQDTAGVAPERPNVLRQDSGGRVLLSADPLLDALLVEADPAVQWPLVQRALYLLLPSDDWRQVSAQPRHYLCQTTAAWKPAGEGQARPKVVRLALDRGPGSELLIARAYLTRRTTADRLQRLAALGYSARMDFHAATRQRKATHLLVEPAAEGKPVDLPGQGPALGDCDVAPATAASATEPLPATPAGDAPDTVKPAPKKANTERPNTIAFGAEQQSGKPLRLSTWLSRAGLLGDDTLKVEAAEQRKRSADVEYSRDFFLFDSLGRRVQLSAAAFSDFTPDRIVVAGRADERREGVRAHALVDLWRDVRGTFGQLDLGLARSDIALEGAAAAAARRVTLASVALLVGGGAQGTPRSERWEAGATLAGGHARPGGGFGKLGAQGTYHRFVGDFERWDLRVAAAAVSSSATVAEWPTFGGEESVRGLRAEAAAARRTWSVQNEYWVPMSFLAPGNEDLARTLRRSAALALFADIGGLAAGSAPSGTRAGAGAGVRLTLSDAFVVRLDWARSVGDTRSLQGDRNRFYLTVTSYRSL